MPYVANIRATVCACAEHSRREHRKQYFGSLRSGQVQNAQLRRAGGCVHQVECSLW